jgi:hypothetical protein
VLNDQDRSEISNCDQLKPRAESQRMLVRLPYRPMTIRRTVGLCLCAFPLLAAEQRSWPTLHGDLQRSGFYTRFPQPPLKLVWRKELWRELTGPRAEVIVSDGLAFMGTYAGTMHAWDAETGDEKWTFKTGQPIGHSRLSRTACSISAR